MFDGDEPRQIFEFVFLHKVIFGSAAGSILGFGFLAGRYVLDRQISIVKQENELIEERLKQALAEVDEKTKALLSRNDPLADTRIKERKEISDRTASFRFVVAAAVLFTLLLSGASLYWLNGLSIRQGQQFAQSQQDRKDLQAEIQKVQAMLKAKANPGSGAARPATNGKALDKSQPASKSKPADSPPTSGTEQ